MCPGIRRNGRGVFAQLCPLSSLGRGPTRSLVISSRWAASRDTARGAEGNQFRDRVVLLSDSCLQRGDAFHESDDLRLTRIRYFAGRATAATDVPLNPALPLDELFGVGVAPVSVGRTPAVYSVGAAVQQAAHPLGQLVAIGVSGDVVRGLGSVVVGGDDAENTTRVPVGDVLGSPVSIDSSTAARPSVISPSTGIFSPGLTRTRSPVWTWSTGTRRSWPWTSSRASLAPISSSLLIASRALPWAVASK
jgi:hypothetical protein